MSSTRTVKIIPSVLRLTCFLLCFPLAACSFVGDAPAESQSLAQATEFQAIPEVVNPPASTETAPNVPMPTAAPTAAPSPTAGPTPIPPVGSLMEFDRFTPYPLTGFGDTISEAADRLLMSQDFQTGPHAYSPDGSLVAVELEENGGGNTFLIIMDAYTTELVSSFPLGYEVYTGLSFSPDGRKLVYATNPPLKVVVWDTVRQEVERVLLEDSDGLPGANVAVSPDGSQVAVVYGYRVSIYELSSGRLLRQAPAVNFGGIMPYDSQTLPKYSQDGSRLAVFTQTRGREITVYDTTTWNPIRAIPIPGEGSMVLDFSPNGRWIASAEQILHPPVLIFDVDSGEQVAVLDEPLSLVFRNPRYLFAEGDLAFTPDSRLLFASGGNDQVWQRNLNSVISVWDTSTWQRLGSIYGPIIPRRMIMAGDGLSFTIFDGVLDIWRPEPPALIAARAALLRFNDALQARDYEAAGLEYANSYLISAATSEDEIFGGDPASELETICDLEPNPCPPLRQILFGNIYEEFGSCLFYVHFSAPDGSLFTDSEGQAIQTILLNCDPAIDLYQVVELSLFNLAFPP